MIFLKGMNISVTCRNSLVPVVIGLFLLAGCAGMKTKGAAEAVSPEPASGSTTMGWRSVRFQNDWPEGAAAEWHMDAMLAHRVVGPILERYRHRIMLWRFHRRAARDSAGHVFSFIFYSDSISAQQIGDAFRADPLVEELLLAGCIRRVFSDVNGPNLKPAVGDTSDQNWPPVVRDAWPYFIMGVSKTWLEMIDAEAAQYHSAMDNASADSLMSQYRLIDNAVRQAWQVEGHHAFLHHLNAVFGYAPVSVGQEVLMKF